ncbi:hypothetical protein AGMMS50268_17180 [Spirochaetia bacterium]|nr:hypothetical protein AGMMS50268_17180 [Spirochaetia bacterium]
MIGREDYEERKENRISRYEGRAADARSEADSQHKKAESLASVIPFGQPILVGHHSEGRHRAHLKKVEGAFRKSFEADDKAGYYLDKAETAKKNHAISGDNPEALDLYRKKLAGLQKAQEEMKAINAAFKKGGKDAAKATMEGFGYSEKTMINVLDTSKWFLQDKPFAPYALTNNNANIRTVKQKIEALEKLDVRESVEKITFQGGELVENEDVNRVQFIFDGKPGEEVRALLKSYGFRWAPSEGAWQRQRTLNAIHVSKRLISQIEELTKGA